MSFDTPLALAGPLRKPRQMLGEQAQARGDLQAALENFYLYKEYDRSGLETLRTIADLHEKKGEALPALRVNEQALCFNASDKDLLERKERYYFSVTPAELQANLESIRNGFDVNYCLTKAKSLLDFKDADADVLDWAQHLADVALVVQPACIGVRCDALSQLLDCRIGVPLAP